MNAVATPGKTVRKPLSTKYLHLKHRLASVKPITVLPPAKAPPSRRYQRTIVDRKIKRNEDKSKAKTSQRSVIMKQESKPKKSSQSCAKRKSFSKEAQKSTDVNKEVHKSKEKKASVEEIKKSLNQWRVQREAAVRDYQSGGGEKRKIGAAMMRRAWTHSSVFPCKNVCDEVGNENPKKAPLNDCSKNNGNTTVKTKNGFNNAVLKTKETLADHDKECGKNNDRSNEIDTKLEAVSNRLVQQNCKTKRNSGDVCGRDKSRGTGNESTVEIREKHEKSIYALVDRYLNMNNALNETMGRDNANESMKRNNTIENIMRNGLNERMDRNDRNETMDYFIKYMLYNVDLTVNSEQVKEQLNRLYFQPENSEGDTGNSKYRYTRNTGKSKPGTSKYVENCDVLDNTENSKIETSKVIGKRNKTDGKSVEKAEGNRTKMLTLVNSKQMLDGQKKKMTLIPNELCLHINYEPHSKLTILKESLVGKPQVLTKHTFTTDTCCPLQFSGRPNISTRYLVHLDEGGCKEIKEEEEEEMITAEKEIKEEAICKETRLDRVIHCLVSHVKSSRLSPRMNSALCEQLLSLQEFLGRDFSMKTLDRLPPHLKRAVSLIVPEVENSQANLNVKTNDNLRLVLQIIMEKVQKSDVLDNSEHSKIPPPKTRKRKFRKSFGMQKSYLNKKIRSALDKQTVNLREKELHLLRQDCDGSVTLRKKDMDSSRQDCDGSVNLSKKELHSLRQDCDDSVNLRKKEIKSLRQDRAGLVNFRQKCPFKRCSTKLNERLDRDESKVVKKQSSEDCAYESDVTVSCVSSVPPKPVAEPGNLAEIKIRLNGTKEQYRISVKQDGEHPAEKSSKAGTEKGGGNTEPSSMDSQCDIAPTHVPSDRARNPILAYKSRTTFTNNDKPYGDCISKPDFAEDALPGKLNRANALANAISGGDNHLASLWPVDVDYNLRDAVDKVNIGVNTDASLLDNYIRWRPISPRESYSCDLSFCMSTDNDLSEGEIGLYIHNSEMYHRVRLGDHGIGRSTRPTY